MLSFAQANLETLAGSSKDRFWHQVTGHPATLALPYEHQRIAINILVQIDQQVAATFERPLVDREEAQAWQSRAVFAPALGAQDRTFCKRQA